MLAFLAAVNFLKIFSIASFYLLYLLILIIIGLVHYQLFKLINKSSRDKQNEGKNRELIDKRLVIQISMFWSQKGIEIDISNSISYQKLINKTQNRFIFIVEIESIIRDNISEKRQKSLILNIHQLRAAIKQNKEIYKQQKKFNELYQKCGNQIKQGNIQITEEIQRTLLKILQNQIQLRSKSFQLLFIFVLLCKYLNLKMLEFAVKKGKINQQLEQTNKMQQESSIHALPLALYSLEIKI